VIAVDRIHPEFVHEIPRELESGKLYVTMEYGTAVHLCCCGCGYEVVTPLHPTRWTLIYDGEAVSLRPSVGSWSLPCRSHYLITGSEVRWARVWSDAQVQRVRARDRAYVERYFGPDGAKPWIEDPNQLDDDRRFRLRGLVDRLWRWLSRRGHEQVE
jgi:Family of unknown function (DUF6527)